MSSNGSIKKGKVGCLKMGKHKILNSGKMVICDISHFDH